MNIKGKRELFNELADWIIDKEPNYPSFGESKLWIKRNNPQYVFSKKRWERNSNVVDISPYEPTNE